MSLSTLWELRTGDGRVFGSSISPSMGGVAPLASAVAATQGLELRPFNLSERLLSFDYENSFDKKGRLTLRVENEDLAYFDSPALMKGTFVSFSWGYPGNTSEVHTGFVSGLRGFRTISIQIMEEEGLLDWVEASEVWEGRTRSQIATQLATDAGFSMLKITETTDVGDYKQVQETDREFLVRIAEEINFVMFTKMENGVPTFHFHPKIGNAVPIRTFVWRGGEGLVKAFDIIENSIVGLPGAIEGTGYDPDLKVPISALGSPLTSKSTPLGQVTEVVNAETGQTTFVNPTQLKRAQGKKLLATAAAQQGDLNKRVAGAWDAAQEDQFHATMTLVGDPELDATQYIVLRGVPKMLEGVYYIEVAQHKVGEGYATELKLLRNAFGDLPIAPQQRTAVANLPNFGQKDKSSGELSPFEVVNPETGQTGFRVYTQQ